MGILTFSPTSTARPTGSRVCVSLESRLVYASLLVSWAKRDTAKLREKAEQEGKDPAEAKLPPEFRLWFSMLGGSVAIPISLYWMAWTSDANISIWSPLIASVFFGYGECQAYMLG
jgi:hypothetical protein